MDMQHGDKLDGDLSGAPVKPSVEVICVNDHTFKITSDQLKTTETGKSAIAFCPVCGGVSRVSKRNVGKLLGFKANDTKAFNAALKRIRSAQLNVSPEAINAPPQAPDLSRGKEVEIVEKGKEKEYEAEEEEVDVGGGEKIRRLRVRDEEEDEGDDEEGDEDEDYEDEEYEDEDEGDEEYEDEEEDRRPPRRKPRAPKPKRVIRPKKIPEEDLRELDREARKRGREDEEEEGDEEESFEDRVARNRDLIQRPRRRSVIEDEEFDPNTVLKEIIAESGLDEFTVERIFDYIDLQPDGWQPAQLIGVLDPWMPRAAAQRLVARYQAELFKEQKRKEKEQQMMSILGPAAGNIRLTQPGINQPLVIGGGGVLQDETGAVIPGASPSQRIYAQDPRLAYQQRSGEPTYVPRPVPRPNRAGMSEYETRELIAEAVAREVGKFQQAMMAQQREDVLRRENEELKRQLAGPRPMAVEAPHQNAQNIQDKYMENQNQILTMLLKHALEGGKSDLTGALLTEIRELKKSTEQSIPGIGGASKASDLKDIVELQRLSNDINIAKMEFEENVEGKKFTKDLVESALQQIGQTIAQVVATRQAPISTIPGGMPYPPQAIPPQPMQVESPPEAKSEVKPEAKPEDDDIKVKPGASPREFNVRVEAKDGKMQIPCPECGATMIAEPGDVIVTCPKDKNHQFSLEPPKDVVDALTGEKPKQEEKSEEKKSEEEKKPEETPSKGQVY